MAYADPEEGRRKNAAGQRRLRAALRLETIEAYGGRCVCCGEDWPMFLTIDHIDGDGWLEKGKGWHLYKRLKSQGWPKDKYQLLCFNCNSAKGQCPDHHALGTAELRALAS